MMDVLLLRFNVIHLRNISVFCLQAASRIYGTHTSMSASDVWRGITCG